MKNHPTSSATPPKHGGDIFHLARTLGVAVGDLLDFSANINPLGYPAGIARALEQALPEIVHYPDHRSLELRRRLAAYHNLTVDEILVGNGSTELIFLAVRGLQPGRGLIVAPAFSEYAQAFQVAGVPLDYFITSEEHHFTLQTPPDPRGADLVFLANPASPSGALLTPERLAPMLAALDRAGTRVLLDEAFMDFVEEASFKAMLRQFPRLLILRSFTKFFGIPGLRLGYLLGAPDLVAQLQAIQEPWSVSSLAQAVGLTCLEDLDFMVRTRAFVDQERAYLLDRLAAIPGLFMFPSTVNYLLVKLTRPGWTAGRLRQALLAHRVVIRDASNFQGLDERYFRIAVRRREENDRLLSALEDALTGG